MPLQRGEVQGYDFNRMAVEFTMVNQGKVVPCSIPYAPGVNWTGKWLSRRGSSGATYRSVQRQPHSIYP